MLADRLKYSTHACSLAKTLAIVGERWTLLVLREAFYGLRRFDDIHAAVGCARNLLTNRLAKLVAHGILRKEPYREPGQRVRYQYRLTEKGLDLYTTIVAIMQWGDRHEAPAGGPPLLLRHRDCGAPIRAEITCERGHRHLTARSVTPEIGPGAKLLLKRKPARLSARHP